MARRKGGIVIYPRSEVELDGKNPEIGLAIDLGDVPERHSYLYTLGHERKSEAHHRGSDVLFWCLRK